LQQHHAAFGGINDDLVADGLAAKFVVEQLGQGATASAKTPSSVSASISSSSSAVCSTQR